jgi:hypothetical protein
VEGEEETLHFGELELGGRTLRRVHNLRGRREVLLKMIFLGSRLSF